MRAVLVAMVFLGCGPELRLETRPSGGPSQALEVLNRRQCAKCHTVETVFGSSARRGSHEEVPARKLPTLSSMERFNADWLRAFLAAPYVVRPNLVERMVPQGLTPREIELLVTSWRAVGPAPALVRADAPDLARGAALFDSKQCSACHVFGGRPTTVIEPPVEVRLRALAPNLALTRDRLPRAAIEALILDPASVKPASQMPRGSVTPDEARALADFITLGDASPPLAAEVLPP